MKPEVLSALGRLQDQASTIQISQDIQTVRWALENADFLCVEAGRCMLDVAMERMLLYPDVNIDAIHHSQQDREHVHYLGGSGHSTSAPTP